MPNLSYRSKEKELIDDLELDNDSLRQNLEELAIINKYLGGNQVTLSGLSKLMFDVRDSMFGVRFSMFDFRDSIFEVRFSMFDSKKRDNKNFFDPQIDTENQTSKTKHRKPNIEHRNCRPRLWWW